MEDEQTNRTKSASEDSFYIKELKQGNIKAFEFLFNKYYKDLVYFCNVFLKDQENSEDLVQDIFARLWENREHLDIKGALTYIIHSGFISGYQNRYGDNLKPPTNVYHRMTA